MVTPASGVRHTLSPLTFRSCFRSIQEEKEQEDENEDECNNVWLNYRKKPISENSNKVIGKGFTLTYELSHQRDGKMVVKLTTEDIKTTDSYWSTKLIGFVLGLPVRFWLAEVLSKAASAIRKPLYMDKYTADMNCISYARVLVEVDIFYPLIDSIVIENPFGTTQQTEDYDWRPKFCNDCFWFGHNTEECWMNHNREKEEN
ncbi:hypothetical protein RDI58_020496 [Solanum bulbocastanum]|uniref:DUF4283 domain-containing protein n=1 Tax=Solanum bulbocastanum TaxID=147425 RepID=A0AAN8T8V8_SOLBU